MLTSFDNDTVIHDPTCSVHPFIRRSELLEPPCYFKVQIISIKDEAHQDISDLRPPIDPSLPDTIPAAASTNCVIWIPALFKRAGASKNRMKNIEY
jgi:hypothetical protein